MLGQFGRPFSSLVSHYSQLFGHHMIPLFCTDFFSFAIWYTCIIILRITYREKRLLLRLVWRKLLWKKTNQESHDVLIHSSHSVSRSVQESESFSLSVSGSVEVLSPDSVLKLCKCFLYTFLFLWLGLRTLSLHQISIALSGLNSLSGKFSVVSKRRSSRDSFVSDVLLFVLMTFSCEKTRSSFPLDAGNEEQQLN